MNRFWRWRVHRNFLAFERTSNRAYPDKKPRPTTVERVASRLHALQYCGLLATPLEFDELAKDLLAAMEDPWPHLPKEVG